MANITLKQSLSNIPGITQLQPGAGLASNGSYTVVNANTGIVANTSGTFVNSEYIATVTVNSANNADYLDGQHGSYYAANSQLANYQTTAGLSANVATLTANNSTYAFGKTEGNLNVNSAQSAVSANNADYLDGQDSSYYAANSQLANYALLSGATFSGVTTFNANLTMGAADHIILSSTSGISANNTYGQAGQVLTTNGSAAYWATAQGGSSGGFEQTFLLMGA